jgi:SpoVK/Ycf46/Vps4 family AAA+-type ATPase
LGDRYDYGILVELDAQSLFSKYFAESGKLVQQMFDQLHTLLKHDNCFVVVLMDEVESITASRNASLAGLEPSDSIRVVNCLLTQLDRLRHCQNVLVLATTNIEQAIDFAFLDRADIKIHIEKPSPRACYTIMSTCLHELIRCKLIPEPYQFLEWSKLGFLQDLTSPSILLQRIAHEIHGVSGRQVSKLIFNTFASHVKVILY